MEKPEKRPLHWKRYVVLLAVVWTIIISASFIWNTRELKIKVEETARTQANMAYDKNIIYRRWNTDHGGVYVEVSDDVLPNPYLSEIPERDITTPTGRVLTLMNPAFMMRQIYEITEVEFGIMERLISLDPLNPANTPDSWEADAIREFERGSRGKSFLDNSSGAEIMRLIRPLYTEKRCMNCHASQGYSVGDVHGALSIIVPMAPLWEAEVQSLITLKAAHAIIWVVGLVGIMLFLIRLKHDEEEIQNALGEKEKLLAGIHERITNNLQTICALLQIQSHAVERGDDVKLKDVLDDFKSRINSMAEIHNILHRSGEFNCVDFRRCTEDVALDLMRTYKMDDRIKFRVQGELKIGILRAIPCALIINELIINALKHAFPDGKHGKIRVTLSEETAGVVEIKVRDNGANFDETIDWRHPVSVGLDLVNGLVIQIHGTLDLDTSDGTEFSIKFKRDE